MRLRQIGSFIPRVWGEKAKNMNRTTTQSYTRQFNVDYGKPLPMTDPWDERYIYVHANHEAPFHVGEYFPSSHGYDAFCEDNPSLPVIPCEERCNTHSVWLEDGLEGQAGHLRTIHQLTSPENNSKNGFRLDEPKHTGRWRGVGSIWQPSGCMLSKTLHMGCVSSVTFLHPLNYPHSYICLHWP